MDLDRGVRSGDLPDGPDEGRPSEVTPRAKDNYLARLRKIEGPGCGGPSEDDRGGSLLTAARSSATDGEVLRL